MRYLARLAGGRPESAKPEQILSGPCGFLSRKDLNSGICLVGRASFLSALHITGAKGRHGGRRWRVFRRAAAWSWSAAGLPGASAPGCFDTVEEGVKAGGEPLVAVVGPDVLAEGGQGGEVVGGQ